MIFCVKYGDVSDNSAAAVTAAVEPARKLIGFQGFELFIFRAKLHALILRCSSQTANCRTQIFVYAENACILNETPGNRSVLGRRQTEVASGHTPK